MVVYEALSGGLTRAYSDRSMLIYGGVPEGGYAEAIDPTELHREYVETDIPIPETETETEQKARAYDILTGGEG